MPGGWLQWTFEQYGFNHQIVSSLDFKGDLSAKYDTIVLPAGITAQTIVNGLDPARNDKTLGMGLRRRRRRLEEARAVGARWRHAGRDGQLRRNRAPLLDLPIAKVLPEAGRAPSPRRARGAASDKARRGDGRDARVLRETFTSPARLAATLRERVIEPESLFYCPGSLLAQRFRHRSHPVGFGMPASWPVFFESDQAYRLASSFDDSGRKSCRAIRRRARFSRAAGCSAKISCAIRPTSSPSRVGRGYVVTLGTQVHFRAQNRATYKLLFNAMFHGPSTPVTAEELGRLSPAPAATSPSSPGAASRN